MTIKKMTDKLSIDPAKQKAESTYSGYCKIAPRTVGEAKATYAYAEYTCSSGYRAGLLTTDIAPKNSWIKRRPNIQRSVSALGKVKKFFVVSNPVKVNNFLTKHPRLVDFLLEAAEKVRNYFPSEELYLEVVSDPELGGDEELFAYIKTTLSVEEALEKLDEFDEMWFLDQLETTSGIFNFNLRFV